MSHIQWTHRPGFCQVLDEKDPSGRTMCQNACYVQINLDRLPGSRRFREAVTARLKPFVRLRKRECCFLCYEHAMQVLESVLKQNTAWVAMLAKKWLWKHEETIYKKIAELIMKLIIKQQGWDPDVVLAQEKLEDFERKWKET